LFIFSIQIQLLKYNTPELLLQWCGDATSYTHPFKLQVKNGLCSATLQALPILHFVLLPIFNCNTFLLQCNFTIWHFVIQLCYISNSQAKHTKHSNKKDSHSNHHHHSFIAV
jgi:hypothetical protein